MHKKGIICNKLITSSKHCVELRLLFTLRFNTLVTRFDLSWLIERNAEALGSHTRGSGLQVLVPLTHLFDFLLTALVSAERSLEKTFLLQVLEEVIELCDNLGVVSHLLPGLGKHGGLDGLQEGRQVILQPSFPHGDLLSVISSHRHVLALLDVLRTNIQSNGDTLQLPMIVFPA